MFGAIFCYGDEENGHRACTSDHLTTANQSEIHRAYLFSAWKEVHGIRLSRKQAIVIYTKNTALLELARI